MSDKFIAYPKKIDIDLNEWYRELQSDKLNDFRRNMLINSLTQMHEIFLNNRQYYDLLNDENLKKRKEIFDILEKYGFRETDKKHKKIWEIVREKLCIPTTYLYGYNNFYIGERFNLKINGIQQSNWWNSIGYEISKNNYESFIQFIELKLREIHNSENYKKSYELRRAQLYQKALELNSQKVIPFSAAELTFDGLIKIITEEEKQKFTESINKNKKIQIHCCSECDSRYFNEHRCSCGDRRINWYIEGDLISGFYIFTEAY